MKETGEEMRRRREHFRADVELFEIAPELAIERNALLHFAALDKCDELVAIALVQNVRDEIFVRRAGGSAGAPLSRKRQRAFVEQLDVRFPIEIELKTPIRLAGDVVA